MMRTLVIRSLNVNNMDRETKKYFNYLLKRAVIRREFKDLDDQLGYDLLAKKITGEDFKKLWEIAYAQESDRLRQLEKIYKVTR